jgi:hypothetical protein
VSLPVAGAEPCRQLGINPRKDPILDRGEA